MTLLIPETNWKDRLLLMFGRIRMIVVPKYINKIYEDCGIYVVVKASRESFWKALFRRKDH